MAAEGLDDVGSTRRHAALALIGGSFICVVGMTAPFVLSQIRSPLPFMATPRAKVDRALRFMSSRSADAANADHAKQVGRRREFVDLGSGDGTAILAAASQGYRATGFELNSSLWIVSSLRRLFSQHRSNAQFVLGDMFGGRSKKMLRKADIVMIFGVKPLMPKIAKLVQDECRPGTCLLSYRFHVPLSTQHQHASDKNSEKSGELTRGADQASGTIDAELIYDEEEMRIYELRSGNGQRDAER